MTDPRAYAVLVLKALDEDQRTFEGIASTPNLDRQRDIVEPLGGEFTLPTPLLLHHDRRQPVGEVFWAKASPDGVAFQARIPKVDEPGRLKDRLDEAWQSVKAGLIRGVSLGLNPIEAVPLRNGGTHYKRWNWLELSLVTLPANIQATITAVKAYAQPAAPGEAGSSTSPPGAAGPVRFIPTNTRSGAMNYSDTIKSFEATRAAKVARMAEIQEAATKAGGTKDQAQAEEFDTLHQELASVDKELRDLAVMQQLNVQTAKAVDGSGTDAAAAARGGAPVVRALEQMPPGIRFARVIKAMGVAAKSNRDPSLVAAQMYPDDALVAKAAVAAGTTTEATWAKPLVGDEGSVFADFVEFLRPMTILGRFGSGGVPSLRRVPFRVPLVGQTTGGAGYWVGEGKAKPLTKFDFSRSTLEPLKVANIAVLTEEVLKSSSPSAEVIVRDSLAAALSERTDLDFIDPAKAAVPNVSPASITNAAVAIPSSGVDADAVRADIQALFAAFIAANNRPTAGVFVMSATTALALSLMTNPLGQPEFSGISMTGGQFFGLPVLVSEYIPTDSSGSIVVLLNASDVYFADEGGISVDVSREASLEMDSEPAHDSGTPTPAQLVSLWQTNSVGFRAERTLNWKARRSTAIQYLSGVLWGS